MSGIIPQEHRVHAAELFREAIAAKLNYYHRLAKLEELTVDFINVDFADLVDWFVAGMDTDEVEAISGERLISTIESGHVSTGDEEEQP